MRGKRDQIGSEQPVASRREGCPVTKARRMLVASACRPPMIASAGASFLGYTRNSHVGSPCDVDPRKPGTSADTYSREDSIARSYVKCDQNPKDIRLGGAPLNSRCLMTVSGRPGCEPTFGITADLQPESY
jgi:hypothetical protein